MHLYRFTFAAGLAIGFVAGTRAGRERYDQMVKFARTTAENPTVQQAAGAIQAQATGLFSSAAKKVGGGLQEHVPHLAHSAAHTVGDHIAGLKHRNNGHRNGRGNSAPDGEAGHTRPFAATSNSNLGHASWQEP
ncbi:MAG: hypothetical protein ACLQFR_09430 [Streptosporangiaceae bacterium]